MCLVSSNGVGGAVGRGCSCSCGVWCCVCAFGSSGGEVMMYECGLNSNGIWWWCVCNTDSNCGGVVE